MVRTHWTPGSWECYKNNCICTEACANFKECQYIAQQMKDKQPPMKKSVEELLESGVAIPLVVTNTKADFMTPDLVKTLFYWVAEGLTDTEMAERFGISESALRDKKSRLLKEFNYSFKYNSNKRADSFKSWATTDLIPELLELRKVGVEC